MTSDFAASREGAARGGRNDEADSGRRKEGHKAAKESLQHHHYLLGIRVQGGSVDGV